MFLVVGLTSLALNTNTLLDEYLGTHVESKAKL